MATALDSGIVTEWAAIHAAAGSGNAEVLAELLVAHPEQANVRDTSDLTPLKLACRGHHTAAVRVLLQYNGKLGDGDEVRH